MEVPGEGTPDKILYRDGLKELAQRCQNPTRARCLVLLADLDQRIGIELELLERAKKVNP